MVFLPGDSLALRINRLEKNVSLSNLFSHIAIDCWYYDLSMHSLEPKILPIILSLWRKKEKEGEDGGTKKVEMAASKIRLW